MIKESIQRKLIITTFALFVFLFTLSFPKTEEKIKETTISYEQGNPASIYLLDSSHYVSRTDLFIEGDTPLEEARNRIEFLTIGGKYNAYLPSLFEAVIPKGTKVLSIDLQDTTLKINFSKEFLNIPKGYEEKMIECLVYTLTEIENIDGIILFVDGDLLKTMPNTGEELPLRFTREIGVNKTYQMDSIKNVMKTTVYYIAKEDDFTYYVPVTLLENNEKEKIEVIIEHLKSRPHEKTNLMSYLNASTELSHYEVLESEVLLSFSPVLYEGLASEEILEEVKYAISLSIQDSLNVKNVIFLN